MLFLTRGSGNAPEDPLYVNTTLDVKGYHLYVDLERWY